MKFNVGDQVVEKAHLRPYYNWLVYKVVSILDGVYLTEFYGDGFGQEVEPYENEDDVPDTRSWRSSIQKYQESELLSVEEAKQELLRLEAEKDKLENEFAALKVKIQSRMEQATALVKEAQDIAESVGKNLDDAPVECRPLFRALREAGWTPSSMSC